MIRLTLIGGKVLFVAPAQVQAILDSPEGDGTMVCLQGVDFRVKESVTEIVERLAEKRC
jgi:uncharacterized protein YlzI (FlbEa/FlbD family)